MIMNQGLEKYRRNAGDIVRRVPLSADAYRQIDHLRIIWDCKGRGDVIARMVEEYLDYLRREGKLPVIPADEAKRQS